jgi:Protein kinase domain
MAELPEGTVFAGHRIDGVAGRGGMGVVYRATHLALDHVVALKVIAPELADDPRFRERFVRESRTAVSIRHPNVVQVRHAGEEDGVLFVTMDYVEGSDLRALVNAERRIEPVRGALIIAQVAAALDAAHELGLVHRDVKPGNVLIEVRDGDEHVYLTDFGLTKRMSGATELTASGAFIGTLEYMAPEQIRGGELDARTDVYALGGVAFTTLTGEPPFGRVDGDVAKLYAHLNDPVPRASERWPALPVEVDPVLQRAMAKKPEERYASAGEFARALEEVVIGPSQVAEPTVTTPVAVPFEPAGEATEETAPAEPATVAAAEPTPPTPSRPEGRRRLLGALAGLAVVGAVVAVVALAGGGDDDDGGGEATGSNGPEPGADPVVVDRIPAGDQTVGVALDGDRLLVGSRIDGRVFAFSTDGDKQPLAEVQIPGSGIDFVVSAFGSVWAAGGETNLLYELDPETLEPTDNDFPTGEFPRDILVTDELMWVTNREGNSLQKINPEAGTSVSESVPGEFPRRLVRDGDRMWISYRDTGAVQSLDVETGKATDRPVDVGGEPHGLFIADGFLWVANTLRDNVQKLDLDDPAGGMEEFPACDEPRDVAVAFSSVWVTCGLGQALVELGPEDGEVRSRLRFETGLETLTTSEDPDRVWVAGGTAGTLFEIDPGS